MDNLWLCKNSGWGTLSLDRVLPSVEINEITPHEFCHLYKCSEEPLIFRTALYVIVLNVNIERVTEISK